MGGGLDEGGGTAQQRPLLRFVHGAGDDDVGVRRGLGRHRSRHHQGQGTGVALLVRGEERTQHGRALESVHPAERQQVGPLPQCRHGAGYRGGSRRGIGRAFEAEADHGLGHLGHGEQALHEGALAPGLEHESAGRGQGLLEHRQVQRRLVVGGGVHDGPVGHEGDAVDRGGIQVGIEGEQVAVARHQGVEEVGTPRPLQLDELLRLGQGGGRRMRQDALGKGEEARRAPRGGAEPVHHHAVQDLVALGIGVGPRHVVQGAGGEDLDRPPQPGHQALGQHAGAELGAAQDLDAVAGHDEGVLHAARPSSQAPPAATHRRITPAMTARCAPG